MAAREREREREREARERERERDREREREREKEREAREREAAAREAAREAREAAEREENSNESLADAAPQTDYPEYLSSYTTICNSEQRSRYKADFNADYNEYRDLHHAVETVSKHFAQLEERLRQEEVNSPGWRSIKQQIMREYQENKRDQQHQEAKRRFQYLHEKLSHIKRLVLEYDSALVNQQY
ncbi:Uncharacterized protein GBIM_12874 [Gryllus bimaculatus]|nr:Uncharacterized protein GBIM_12874 [Gryllus bimaculatus]